MIFVIFSYTIRGKIAVVHRGKVIIKYYRLSHDVVTYDVSRNVSTAYY